MFEKHDKKNTIITENDINIFRNLNPDIEYKLNVLFDKEDKHYNDIKYFRKTLYDNINILPFYLVNSVYIQYLPMLIDIMLKKRILNSNMYTEDGYNIFTYIFSKCCYNCIINILMIINKYNLKNVNMQLNGYNIYNIVINNPNINDEEKYNIVNILLNLEKISTKQINNDNIDFNNNIELNDINLKSKIEKYGRILNFKKYHTPPTIGRDDEIESLILSLAQDKKCPILVGESGVGKTSIIEQLVYMIQNNKVPTFLKNKIIIELSPNDLIVGTKYRGDFENKIKEILDICCQEDYIVFIDEIHTIYGVGSCNHENNDMASIIRFYMDRLNLKVIGTTTTKQYQKFFSDNSLKRRFDKIIIKEPSNNVLKLIIEKAIRDKALLNNISCQNLMNQNSYLIDELVSLTDTRNRKYDDVINNPDLVVGIIDKAFAIAKVIDSNELKVDHFIKSVTLCDNIYNVSKERFKGNVIENQPKIKMFYPKK